MYSVYWYNKNNQFVSCLEAGSREAMESLRLDLIALKAVPDRFYYVQLIDGPH
jgi:hypothetical protein